MRPEFLSHPVGRLRPENLLVVELNALDLFEETFDIPALVVKSREILRGSPEWIQNGGHQSIYLVRPRQPVLDYPKPEGRETRLLRRGDLSDVGAVGQHLH